MTQTQELLDVEESLLKQEELILEATERLCIVMEDENITKTELARRIGKSKSYVTQCLSGRTNLTLRTLADLFGALGYTVQIEPRPKAQNKLLSIISFKHAEGWRTKSSREAYASLSIENEPAISSQAHLLGATA